MAIKILFEDGRVQTGIVSLTPKCNGNYYYPEFEEGTEVLYDILDDDEEINADSIKLISFEP